MEKPNRPKKDFGEEIYDLMKKHNYTDPVKVE